MTRVVSSHSEARGPHRLLFARHAQSTANVLRLMATDAPGPDLTDLGRQQAVTLARSLDGVVVDRIYAATLARTQQTAAPLARARSLPVVILDELREIQAGDLEGHRDFASVARYVETVMGWATGKLDPAIPGGPDGHAFFLRFDAGVATIERELRALAAEDGGPSLPLAAVFSHGAAIRIWVASRCANIPGSYAADHELHNTGTVLVERRPDGRWEMLEWNVGDPSGPDALTTLVDGGGDPGGETLAQATKR